MIKGTGIDIVNIERIERLMGRWGDQFLNRVYTEEEISRCKRMSHPSECFAIRFAAKEAFLKAIGSGLRHGIQWTDIEVKNDPMGRPFLHLCRKAEKVLQSHQIERTYLTLSHDRPFAVAHVLLEGEDDESSDR
jgi:holo-[acyl-carrier protein] synthase